MSWSFLCSIIGGEKCLFIFFDNGRIVDNHYLKFLFIKFTCLTRVHIKLLLSSSTSSVWHASPCWKVKTTV
jgi:hypothetical protein